MRLKPGERGWRVDSLKRSLWGERRPLRRTDGPSRETDSPVTQWEPGPFFKKFSCAKSLNCTCSSYDSSCRAEPLRKAKFTSLRRTWYFLWCCVQFRCALFLRSRALPLFASFWTQVLEKSRFSPGEEWGFWKEWCPENTPLWRSLVAFQKRDIYVAQHRHPISNATKSPTLERNAPPPPFSTLFCLPPIPRSPYFYSVFLVETGRFHVRALCTLKPRSIKVFPDLSIFPPKSSWNG